MRAAAKAQNEGRLLDAEKILTDAIAEMQEKDPKSPRPGDYLRRLAVIVALNGDSSQAAALNPRALQRGGLQDAGSQWSVDFFIELQEN